MSNTLNFLSAGAAQGLLRALQPAFEAEFGRALQGRFGAVGAMKEALLAGEPCDLLVLTETLMNQLVDEGLVRRDSCAPLGRVRTGVAVRADQPRPDVSTPDALRATLQAADAIYFPDPVRATAGIHFAKVMQELGVLDELQSRFRTFPNGATAMRELAASTAQRPVGCTQVTEILYTPGVHLVAVLPAQFELATTYTAAVTTASTQALAAGQLVALMSGAASLTLRQAGGFE